MKNLEAAEILNKIADYLELKEDIFRVRAYRKAALSIEGLSEDIEKIWRENRLQDIPGVGEGIAKKIGEFLKDDHSAYLYKLKKETPVDMEQLGSLQGIGPKTILKLYKKLHVKNISDLEKAARKGRISSLEGFGPTAEKNIIKSIEFSKTSRSRVPLGFALSSAEQIISELKSLKEVNRVSAAGSVRRMKETIGDIDILATSSSPEKVMDFFASLPYVKEVLSRGDTKSSVRLKEGIQADLRVLDDRIYGAALLYFTGNMEHNVVLRKIAIKNGMKLSEYGLFNSKTKKFVAGRTEGEVYGKLGMQYIEPEMRENVGEIELALRNKLPRLIDYGDIRGDLQMHTNWSDGSNTIEEMALSAKSLGHEYIAITDHGGKLRIANALNEKRILRQFKEIEKISKKLDFPILKGTEVDIEGDGSLALNNRILRQFDIVVASIHSGFKNSREKITRRVIMAMENEHVDIIAHPTGRIIGKRGPYDIDLEAVFEKTEKTGTIMEINSYPERMDLKDSHARAAIKSGVKLAISTDSHNSDQLKFIRLGIATARRGWAEKKDIINSRALKDMIRMIKR